MASTPEAKVKAKIKAILKRHGCYYTMPVMTGMATNGTPDFCCCVNGRFLAIEAKAGKGKMTELQKVRFAEVRAAGGMAVMVNEDRLELLEIAISKIMNRSMHDVEIGISQP